MATPRFINFFTTCNFSENEAPLCGRRAVLEGDVQLFGRQEFYSVVLISPLFDRHVIHVSKLVLTRWECICPHAVDGAVVHELR